MNKNVSWTVGDIWEFGYHTGSCDRRCDLKREKRSIVLYFLLVNRWKEAINLREKLRPTIAALGVTDYFNPWVIFRALIRQYTVRRRVVSVH